MIAVVESGRHPFLRGIADAIAEAWARDEGHAPGAATLVALPAEEPSREVEGATAVLALDPESLARAREAKVPVRLAWMGWLDPGWEESIADAQRVLVAHPALVDGAIAMGASRARVEVASWIARRSSAPDRAAARRELGLAADAPVLVVPTQVIGDDLTALLLQLALVRDGVRVIFDVGSDADVARVLRQRVSFHAHMFADGPTADLAWTAADRALARLAGPELARALAHGVAPVLAPAAPAELYAVRALVESDLATVVPSDAMLAVAIDEACSARALERAHAAVGKLAVHEGAARIAGRVERLLREPGARAAAAGLPEGLEAIGPEASPARQAKSEAPPAPSRDEAIERELEALRARVRGGA